MISEDEARAEAIEEDALKLRKRIIGECERCSGTGRLVTDVLDPESMQLKTYPCGCKRQYTKILNLMIAGVQAAMIQEVIHQPLYEKMVVERDMDGGGYSKSFGVGKKYIIPYVGNIERVLEKGYSFLFLGANSTGKTFTAIKILRYFLKAGYTGHYIKFRDLMRLVNKALTERGRKNNYNERLLREIKAVNFLIIDELGKETGSRDHIAGEIEEILKNRDMGRMPTIVISNDEYEEIENNYTVNIVGAFMRNYKVFIFDPRKDFRKVAREEWALNG